MKEKEVKHIEINNRKARFNYTVVDTYVAGIVLQGNEVKSLRSGNGNISEAYCTVNNGEVICLNSYIAEYIKDWSGYDPYRQRKLLLNKKEIRKITKIIGEPGYTLVPLQVYFKNGKAKVEIGLARGKKLYDKREDIAKKDARRETEREFKVRNL